MNTKNTYPPTYTSVSPTTSMSTRARRALKSVELENHHAFDASPQPSKFIVIRRRSAVRDRASRRVRRTIERAREGTTARARDRDRVR